MPYPMARFRQEAHALLQATLDEIAPGTEPTFVYADAPPGQGEYAAGCFPLAGPLKAAPPKIAADLASALAAHLQDAPGAWVESVAAAGPYVNFRIRVHRLAAELLSAAHDTPETFGRLAPRGQRVILEHTSANPNGPLHVGRARNPIIGDTLVRLYRAAGYDTEAQYYVDDMGKQVAMLAWGLEHLDEEAVETEIGPARLPKTDHRLVRFYQATNARMEADPAVREEIQALIHATEHGDKDALARVEDGYAGVFEGMRETLSRLNVAFDRFVKESEFVTNGDTARVIDRLQAQEEVPVGEEGQALFLDLKGKGVTGRSTKFFFRRGDGTSLYATRDVAYHMWKAHEADRLVNVLGEDHKLQAKQVRTCLELMDAPHLPEVVFYSFVSLPEGKMSTRSNRVVFIDDLLDEAKTLARAEVDKRRGDELSDTEKDQIAELVGMGAVRFGIIKVQCEKPITFDWDEALAFDGFAAPFIQYSHARVAGILDKAKGAGLEPDPTAAALLVHDSEAALVKTIARLPAIIEDAADKHRPHMVAQFAYDVATAFNAFYRDCRVIDAPSPELCRGRLALVETARVALASSLDLLGITAPEQM